MSDLSKDIKLLINDLLDKIDAIETNNSNEKILNEQINDQFMKMLDDSSSECSSTSSTSSDSDNENEQDRSKIKQKVLSKTKTIKKKNLEEDDEEEEDDDNTDRKQLANQKYLKTKDELTIDDLGPIERICVIAENDVKLIKMGRVASIVDEKLVIIQSSIVNQDEKNKITSSKPQQPPPLDEETILFDSNRKSVGKIFEIFGPVASPFYSIRFNNSKEIGEFGLDLDIGAYVFYAPECEKYTKYIFNVDELRKLKGSDASWNHDNEPPPEYLDYSDDEKEKQAKKQLKQLAKNKNSTHKDSSTEDGEEESDSDILSANRNNNFSNKRKYNNQMKKSHTNFDGFYSKNNNNNNNSINNNNNNKFNRIPKSKSNNANNTFNQNHYNNQQPPFLNYPNHQFQFHQYSNMAPPLQQGMMPHMPFPSMFQPYQYPPRFMDPMYQQQHFNPYFNQQTPYMGYFNHPPAQQPASINQQPENSQSGNNNIVDRRFVKNDKSLIKKSF